MEPKTPSATVKPWLTTVGLVFPKVPEVRRLKTGLGAPGEKL